MLMPSIFGEDLFDDFMSDFPFFDDKAERRLEKKLYGRRGRNLMKTDVKETDQGYELEMDLPGFTKDEVKVSLENGYLTIQAAKGLDQDEQEAVYIMRKAFNGMKADEAVENILNMFVHTKNNKEFVDLVKKRKIF